MIEYNLNLEAHQLFDGEVELDESYFGGVRKGYYRDGADVVDGVMMVWRR